MRYVDGSIRSFGFSCYVWVEFLYELFWHYYNCLCFEVLSTYVSLSEDIYGPSCWCPLRLSDLASLAYTTFDSVWNLQCYVCCTLKHKRYYIWRTVDFNALNSKTPFSALTLNYPRWFRDTPRTACRGSIFSVLVQAVLLERILEDIEVTFRNLLFHLFVATVYTYIHFYPYTYTLHKHLCLYIYTA